VFEVPPREYLDIEISFLPTQVGVITGTLKLNSNDCRGTREINLIGEGVPAPALVVLPADTLNFPKFVGVGSQDTARFSVKNPGIGQLVKVTNSDVAEY
jgi:hypothetical protein